MILQSFFAKTPNTYPYSPEMLINKGLEHG